VNVIADAVLVEELVELLVIDAMRALHLAIKAWRARADVDVPDVSRLEMPVELRLEFGAVVSLHDVYAERQPAHDLVDELHGRALVARVVDFQDANPGGAPSPAPVMRRVMTEMHLPEMKIAYGLTEASPGITMTPDPDPRCVVTRSAVLGTSPATGVNEMVKISTPARPTSRAALSRLLLTSASASAILEGALPAFARTRPERSGGA
jgi:hypothetical protein